MTPRWLRAADRALTVTIIALLIALLAVGVL